MSNSQTIYSYTSPLNIFPSLRHKPEYILSPQTLSGVTAAFYTDVINMSNRHYNSFGKILMQLTVEINDASVLVDNDYLEIAVESGVEVNGNNKIVGGVTVPFIAYEKDMYADKAISPTSSVNTFLTNDDTVRSMDGKLKIQKNSFAYQKDGTYFVTKFIAFPIMNTAVLTTQNENTVVDEFYGAKITPFGAMANNANVKISVSVFETIVDIGTIHTALIGSMMGL